MMTPQQLKNSILQRAIEGKLVEQRPEEGTAKELLKEIKLEKEKLIKEGKIKKSKPLPAITEDEIPFEIPESWEWVRLIDVFNIINGDRGKNYPSKSILKEHGDIPFISAINIQNGSISKDNLLYVSDERYKMLRSGHLKFGDLVLCIRGSLGKNGRYPFQKGAIASSLVILRAYVDSTYLYDYLEQYLNTGLFSKEIRKYDNGTAQPNLGARDLAKFLVPLPPLSEQHRIVAKIDELLPLVDQYDKAYSQITVLNEKFPQDMKKSILQYAIEGKLVEQRPEEGTAKELLKEIKLEKEKLVKEGKIKKSKPLPTITEDETPFDIPESWEWVRLSDIIDVRDGTHDTPKYYPSGIPLITSKNISTGQLTFDDVKYISEEDARAINIRSNVDDGDILFAMIGSIGNPVLVHKTREFCIKNVALFKPYYKNITFMPYWYWFFIFVQHTMKKEASGGVQSFISLKTFRQFTVPLPPLSEQHRIVAKIEELLPLCDKLVKTK